MKLEIFAVILVGLFGVSLWLFIDHLDATKKYTYVGKITGMEGGSSSKLIILDLDTIGKTPYTVQNKCSNKIRVGQKVYERTGSNYLWVEYEPGEYC